MGPPSTKNLCSMCRGTEEEKKGKAQEKMDGQHQGGYETIPGDRARA